MVGATALWINAAGDFETFVIASYSTSEIVPAHPLSAAPGAGDAVILGAISSLARSGRFDIGVHDKVMGVTDFDVGYVPSGDSTNRLYFASAGDQDTLLLPGLSQATYADLSKASSGAVTSQRQRAAPGIVRQRGERTRG